MTTVIGFLIIGGAIYALVMLLALGLCKSAHECDEAMYDAYRELRDGAE